jgi:hypothetical protein
MRERAAPGFIHYRLGWERVELGDDVVAGFTADEETAEGASVADAETGCEFGAGGFAE